MRNKKNKYQIFVNDAFAFRGKQTVFFPEPFLLRKLHLVFLLDFCRNGGIIGEGVIDHRPREGAMKKRVSWKTIFNVSIILFSVGLLIYFCLSENGLIDLLHNASEFDKGWLLMAVLCHLFNIVLDAYLIFRFTRNSVENYSFRSAFKTCMVGQFFSAVTPGASGGQPMQIYLMTKQSVDAGVATSALIQKFLVYQTALTAYSAFSILICRNLFKDTLGGVIWGLAIFGFITQAFVIVLLLLFSFHQRLTRKILVFVFRILGKIRFLRRFQENIKQVETQLVYFHRSNKELYKNRKLVLETYVCCAIQLTAMFIVPYCIYRSFNLSGARVVDMICAQAFVTMASSFVPLPGASGASEGSFYIFFGLYFTDSTIKSAILLWRIITYYLTILISAPFSRLTKQRKKENLLEIETEDG